MKLNFTNFSPPQNFVKLNAWNTEIIQLEFHNFSYNLNNYLKISGNSEPIENCNFLEEGVTNEQLDDDFTISSDSEWGEGYSWGAVEAGPTGKSIIFYGDLNTTVPRDGRTARAGFVNIKQNPMFAAFGSRKKHLPFETYNAVTLKIRGDGRVYWVNVHREKEKRYDVNWMDLDTYPLITR